MPNFTFDPKEHIYRLDGVVLPSVTQILEDVGFINSDFYTEEARVRGQRVHLLCQFFDEGDYSVGEARQFNLDGYVESWRKLKERMAFKILEIEKPGYHPILKYAGTPDRVAILGNRGCVLDFKTGDEEFWHPYQSAAYDAMLPPVASGLRKRMGIHLHSDGSMATPEPHDDLYDFAHFASMLDVFNQRRLHGITRK